MQNINIEKLKTIGSEWIKGDYHRIYINDLPELYGLSVNRYNTGNISSANLNGESISNTAANKIISRLDGKLYYDLNSGEFKWSYLNDDDAETIIAAIMDKIQ